MTEDFERDPLTGAIRASLIRHAADAPPGDRLTERIIAAAGRTRMPAPQRRPGWRAWTLPIIAAASVGAVVTAVVAIENYRPASDQAAPAATHHATPSGIGSPTLSAAPSSTPTPSTAVLRGSLPAATDVRIDTGSGLPHFHAVDSTFVGAEDGWILGTADCLSGVAGICPAMVRTTNGGRTWTSAPQPPGNPALLTCAAPCITHLRFASESVGYAYSASAFEMTVDGGEHWVPQSGGADALETLDGNVIRLSSATSNCAKPCAVAVQTAPVGSSSWHTVTHLDTPVADGAVRLVRAPGGAAAILALEGPSGASFGYPDTRSWLYTSTDDGATWVNRGDPCRSTVPSTGRPLNAVSVSLGIDGAVGLMCLDDSETSPRAVPLLAESVDARFRVLPDFPVGSPFNTSLSLASRNSLFVVSDRLYRSIDGGASWQRAGIPARKMVGPVGPPGFADARTAHWLTDGSRLWTTHDQGRTWSEVDFP